VGTRGASTIRVELPAVPELKRWITPGAEALDCMVRKPAVSIKAKPEEAPEAESSVPDGTSDAFSMLFPTT